MTTKKWLAMVVLLLMVTITCAAQGRTDKRCIYYNGMPLEGNISQVDSMLKQRGYTAWGTSDDGEDFYFRGDYYGIRIKLMVSIDLKTRLVTSALVTCGPYRTRELFTRNWNYVLNKLHKDHGQLNVKNGAYYYMGDYGMVKMSEVLKDNGSREINIFYLTTAPFYKDAAGMGLHGNVQEVMTENPISENNVEHFDKLGKTENPDLVNREYDAYGYLVKAKMKEQSGDYSTLEYTYDNDYRLTRRTLLNTLNGIRYVNDYSYNDNDEVEEENQHVYDATGDCIMSIKIKNNYTAYDDNNNWTVNTLKLIYWEKGGESQPASVVQKRKITYWE